MEKKKKNFADMIKGKDFEMGNHPVLCRWSQSNREALKVEKIFSDCDQGEL